jgi:transcription-repair coupling factor (superfamily II helicase)
MTKLNNLIRFFPTVLNDRVLNMLNSRKNFSVSGGTNFSSKVFTVADILREAEKVKGAVWIVNNQQEQELIVQTLKIWTDLEVGSFDSKIVGNVPASKLDRMKKLKLMELMALVRSPKKRILVIPYYDLLNQVPEVEWLNKAILKMKKGAEINMMEFYENLIAMGMKWLRIAI